MLYQQYFLTLDNTHSTSQGWWYRVPGQPQVSEVPGTVASSVARNRLRAVKLLHTVVWVFFVACIVAIPVCAWAGRYQLAALAATFVFLEGVILLLNRWRCPLTDVAAHYTGDRRDNFDIYLPEWLARHNKSIFTTLYVAGMLFALIRWILSR